MLKVARIIIALCALVFASKSHALVDGERFIVYLTEYEKSLVNDPDTVHSGVGMYMGLVYGVAEMAIVVNAICPANGMSGEQYLEIVRKNVRLKPQTWHQSATAQILTALSESLPCKKK